MKHFLGGYENNLLPTPAKMSVLDFGFRFRNPKPKPKPKM